LPRVLPQSREKCGRTPSGIVRALWAGMGTVLTVFLLVALSGLVGIMMAWGALTVFFRALDRHSVRLSAATVPVVSQTLQR
jgi:hypothetical protein